VRAYDVVEQLIGDRENEKIRAIDGPIREGIVIWVISIVGDGPIPEQSAARQR